MTPARITLLLALITTIGCETYVSPEEYADMVEEAAACQPGSTCVAAGSSDCVCPMPVDESEREEVESAAESVQCNGIVIECLGHTNVRCEDGRCTSDELASARAR